MVGRQAQAGAASSAGSDPLKQAIATVVFKDSQPFRRSVFAELRGRRRLIRLAERLHKRLAHRPAATAFVALYGLKAYLSARGRSWTADVLAVGEYANERRQFEWLDGVCSEMTFAFVEHGGRAVERAAGVGTLLSELRDPARVASGLKLLHASVSPPETSFLVACRVAATLGYYGRFRRQLAASELSGLVVSSDSNPCAMGAWAAAKIAGLPVAYINHGHLPADPPHTDFALNLLDGPALYDVYRNSLGMSGEVVFKGAEGVSRTMSVDALRRPATELRVGIFLSLVNDWDGVAEALRSIRKVLGPRSIRIRLHPNRTVRDHAAIARLPSGPDITLSDASCTLVEDAAQCDLVVCGGTSAHLTLLKYGIPTVCVPGLDRVPWDFYRFIELGIVASCADIAGLSPSAMADFYERPEWLPAFQRFDPSHLASDLRPQVRASMARLIDLRGSNSDRSAAAPD